MEHFNLPRDKYWFARNHLIHLWPFFKKIAYAVQILHKGINVGNSQADFVGQDVYLLASVIRASENKKAASFEFYANRYYAAYGN